MLSRVSSSMSAPHTAVAHPILFIDPRIDQPHHLIKGADPKAEVILLDPDQDGIEQITKALQQRTDIAAIYIIAHGSPGCVYLGNSELSLDTLAEYEAQLGCWGKRGAGNREPSSLYNTLREEQGSTKFKIQNSHLVSPSPHPTTSPAPIPLYLYSCHVATGDAGTEFLEKFHRLTQAPIHASTTQIGQASLDGNWHLDVQIANGTLTATPKLPILLSLYPPIAASTLATYPSTLSNTAPNAVRDDVRTNEDTAFSGNVLVNNGRGADSDADGDPLTVVAVNGVAANVGTEISLASGSLLTLNADGTFDFDPNGQFDALQNSNGVFTAAIEIVEYTISDGNGGTDTANVFFSINGVNDAAVVTGAIGGTVTEDAAINTTSGQLSANDIDSPNDFRPQTNTDGTYGTFAIDASGNWTYSLDNSDADTDALATGEVANDVFNVATADGTLQAVTITVNGVTDNTAPTVANAIADQTATTFRPFLFTLPRNTFDDADGDSLTLTATLDNGNPLPTWLSFDGAAGTFSGFATGNDVGTLAIQVTADDGTATISDVFDLSIGFPNTPITTNNINGDSTPNSLNGTNANDLISGKGANDVLEGEGGNDILRGGSGADDMNGGRGNDQLLGEGGGDRLFGDRGADTLIGGNGRDILAGGRGDDILDGGNGLDELEGGGGNDFLFGGNGRDILIGGGGRDQFLLLAGTGEDRILDFENGRDTFVLTGGIGFNDLSITTNLADDVLISLNGQRLATVEEAAGLIDATDFVTL